MDLLAPLFTSSFKTDIPLIFQGKQFTRRSEMPLSVSLIGPSGAGKDAIKEKLLITGNFTYVKTATSRQPRQGESDKDYIWMRPQYNGEPMAAYLRALVKQYGLFEFDFHYGNLYGTPLASIKEAFSSRKIPLFCSENRGALYIEKTLAPIIDVLTIAVIPDNLEDMEKRILTGDRDNPTERIEESFKRIARARDFAHFILKNPSTSVDYGKSGLESAAGAVKRLVATYAG